MKKALFLHFLKVATDHLFDDLESGKLLFWEKSGNSLEFRIKKSVRTLLKLCTNLLDTVLTLILLLYKGTENGN